VNEPGVGSRPGIVGEPAAVGERRGVAEILVAGLAITPVKGTRMHRVDRIELGRAGVRENRRFYVIDARNRMVNPKVAGELQTVVADYDDDARRLTLRFPDGNMLGGQIRLGEEVQTRFYSRSASARVLEGPWSEALSDHVGRPLRLVEPLDGGAVDRGPQGSVSLISRASLERLATEAGEDRVDARRFRMLIEVDGVPAHGEDRWVDRTMRVGGARVAWGGHVGRCLVTSRNPETGQIDLPTLDLLGAYRREVQSTEPLPFGIYGRVLEAGAVAVGDRLVLEAGAVAVGDRLVLEA
jgi:MOSC domain-containing protein